MEQSDQNEANLPPVSPPPHQQGAAAVSPVQQVPPSQGGQVPQAGAPQQASVPQQTEPSPPTVQEPRVVQTDEDAQDGLNKCARCGATDISLNLETGMLRCHFCRFEFSTGSAVDAFDLDGDIGLLEGVTIGSGSKDIVPSTVEIMTFKCSACGAEVVIDTSSSTQARCHWCRNTLSMNEQVANGAVPDMILPFKLVKSEAVARIRKFVRKRKTFAHPRFKKEFNAENVMGVYLPYMVVDVNAHATLSGQGEHQVRSYTVRRGENNRERRYDADLYNVVRDADVHINDLVIESSSQRRDISGMTSTNNVINAVRPFDTENAVRYDSNYLRGFTSERRDSNVDELEPLMRTQSGDVARFSTNDTLRFYDRGVRWDSEQLTVKGQRWASAYMPVWLYSYYQKKPNGKTFLHYVAVNARTGKTMGSIPLNKPKLFAVSAVVEVIGAAVGILILAVT